VLVHEINTQNVVINILNNCDRVSKFSASDSHFDFVDAQGTHSRTNSCDAAGTFL